MSEKKEGLLLAWQRLKTSILETKPQDVVRLAVIVVCLLFVYDQIFKSLQKLRNPPISTRTELRFNKTMRYPALTICREPPYKRRLYRKYGMSDIHLGSAPVTSQWIKFPYDTFSIDEFFNESIYELDEMFVTYGLDKLKSNVRLTSTLTYTSGLCFTLHPLIDCETIGKKTGYSVLLNHDMYQYVSRLDDDPGWHIFLHEPKEVFSQNNELLWSRQDYVFLRVGEELDVSLDTMQFNLLSNCSTEGNYSTTKCEENCWLEEVYSQIDCGVPWLPDAGLPPCENYTDLLKVFQASFAMSSKACCVPNCYTTRYRANIRRRSEYVRGSTSSILSVSFSSKAIQTTEETYGYDWNMFVADLGGSVGFLLGISVISIIGLLEGIVGLVFNRKKKTKITSPSKVIEYPDYTWKFDSPVSGSARSSVTLVSAFDKYH